MQCNLVAFSIAFWFYSSNRKLKSHCLYQNLSDFHFLQSVSCYSTYAEKHPVYTVGSSLDELKANMLEAINLYFEKDGKTIKEQDLKITLDLPRFFKFYRVINAKAISERIGMNQSLLAQYIKGNKNRQYFKPKEFYKVCSK